MKYLLYVKYNLSGFAVYEVETDDIFHVMGRAMYCSDEKSVDDLYYLPASDVEEVRHAKWVYKGHHEMMGHAFQCSVCERWIFTNSPKHVLGEYPYYHCGAKMDGGKSE